MARDHPESRPSSHLKARLATRLAAQGPRWRFQLRSGYNLLLYVTPLDLHTPRVNSSIPM